MHSISVSEATAHSHRFRRPRQSGGVGAFMSLSMSSSKVADWNQIIISYWQTSVSYLVNRNTKSLGFQCNIPSRGSSRAWWEQGPSVSTAAYPARDRVCPCNWQELFPLYVSHVRRRRLKWRKPLYMTIRVVWKCLSKCAIQNTHCFAIRFRILICNWGWLLSQTGPSHLNCLCRHHMLMFAHC